MYGLRFGIVWVVDEVVLKVESLGLTASKGLGAFHLRWLAFT